jgi:bile acid-coenzyme A ligase
MTRMTIGEAFGWLAKQDPGRPAVRDDSRNLTRAELESQTNQLARVYRSLGVTPESMVAVSLPNSVDFVLACIAIWKLGATPMPMSPALGAEEQEALLRLAQPSLAVVSGRIPDRSTPTIGPEVNLAGFDDRPLPAAAATCWKAPTTSGSTGRPKIVRSTAGAWIDPESQVTTFIPQEAVQLVVAPLSHSAPFTYAFRGLMTGHSLIIHPGFDEHRTLAEISASRISWMMLVPTMMNRIMRLPASARTAADLSSLESILHIGAPCAPGLKRQWLDWIGPDRVMEVYAGTESQGLTAISGSEWLQRPGSVGRPTGGTSVQVVDEEGSPVSPGTIGEVLLTRSGGPTYEYLGATSRRRGVWDSLGDLGYLDEEGYLYILDRMDDLIVSGGVNIYPAEIERVLEQHPEVRSAVAFGTPDPDLGQRVEAVVDIAKSTIRPFELMEWLSARLDPTKHPKSLKCVNRPVRDDAGKVRRKHMGVKYTSDRPPNAVRTAAEAPPAVTGSKP